MIHSLVLAARITRLDFGSNWLQWPAIGARLAIPELQAAHMADLHLGFLNRPHSGLSRGALLLIVTVAELLELAGLF